MVESTSDAYKWKSSDISYDDLIKCGINMGVSKRKCDAIISYIEDVAKDFGLYGYGRCQGENLSDYE